MPILSNKVYKVTLQRGLGTHKGILLNTEKELFPQSLEGSFCNSEMSPWNGTDQWLPHLQKYQDNVKCLSQAVVLIV